MIELSIRIYTNDNFTYNVPSEFKFEGTDEFGQIDKMSLNSDSLKFAMDYMSSVIMQVASSVTNSDPIKTEHIKKHLLDLLSIYSEEEIRDLEEIGIKEVYLNWDAGEEYGTFSIIKKDQ